MDDSTELLIGLAIGAIAVGVIVVAMQRRHPVQGNPALVSHNVVRDDQGRIMYVETYRGMEQGHGGRVMAEPEAPTVG